MENCFVKLVYRKVLDSNTTSTFEKQILKDAWDEFGMQCQRYNQEGSINNFAQMILVDPKANSLHYKVGFAVGLYIRQLNHIIPGVTDKSGMHAIPFEICEVQIVEADLRFPEKFKIALVYYTPMLYVHTILGNALVLSSAPAYQLEATEVMMVELKDHWSIAAIQTCQKHKPNAFNQNTESINSL